MFVLLTIVLFILMCGLSTTHATSMSNDSSNTLDNNVENNYDNSNIKTDGNLITTNHEIKQANTVNNIKNHSTKVINNPITKISKKSKHDLTKNSLKQSQKEITISSEDASCYVNDKVNLTVLTDPVGVTDGILQFNINGDLVAIHNLSYEPTYYEFNTEGYEAGQYEIQVDFLGSSTYQNAIAYSTLTINKLPTKLGDLSTTYTQDNQLNISFNIISKDKKVDSGTLSVYDNDELINSMQITQEDSNIILPNTYNDEILTFVYTDDNYYYYETMNTSELISVNKKDVDMYIPSLYGYQGSLINSSIIFYNDSLINDGYVYLYVDGIIIHTYEVLSNNVGISIDLSDYAEGVYDVLIEYDGSNVYNGVSYNTTLKINKIKTTMYLNDVTVYRNSIVNLKAFVYNYVGDTNDGVVEFLIDDESIETVLISNNSVNVEYLIPDNLDYGVHSLQAVYLGTQKYASVNDTATITVNKYSNKLSIKNITITDDGQISMDIRAYSYNHTVNDGIVTVYVDGVVVKTIDVTSNDTQIVLPSEYKAGEDYNITVSYHDSNWYNDSTINEIIHVNKTDTTIRIYDYLSNKNILTVTSYVYAKNYDDINEGTVEYYINNTLIGTSSIKNNTASITYNVTSYDKGNYTLTAKYTGSTRYNQSTNTTTFERTIYQTRAYITATNKITLNPTDTLKINATIHDYNSNAITETIPTKIIINDQTINTYFKNGLLEYSYQIPKTINQQTTTIQIITQNTTYHKSATKNITLTIKKNTTYLSGYSNIHANKLESIQINTTIYSNKQILTAKTPAIIKINNKTVYTGYFSNGLLQYNLSLAKYTKDSYEITVIAQETTKYQSSTKTINLTLNKRKTYIISQNVYSKKGDKILFNATIMDSITKQPIIGTSNVALKINQITQNVSAVKNGHFVFEYANNLNLETYNITIKFGENSIYTESIWNGTLTNQKNHVKLSLQSINTKVNSTIKIKANILDNGKLVTGKIPVAIKIDDNTIANLNITNGIINYEYKLTEKYSGKTHNLTVVTGETGKYTYSVATTNLIVNKEYRTINTTKITAKSNDTIHIKATILNSNNEVSTLTTPVNIKIAGKNICTMNVTGGIIDYEYKLNNLNKGYYDLLIQAGQTSLYHHVTKHEILQVT